MMYRTLLRTVLSASALLLLTALSTPGHTTTDTTKTAPAKPAPAKTTPAKTAAQPAKAVARPAAAQPAQTATQPATASASQATPAATPTPAATLPAVAQPSSAPTPSNFAASPGQTAAGGPAAVDGSDSRAPVVVNGVGSFMAGGQTLTAYGCFRVGTRALCDYDLGLTANMQVNAAQALPVALVGDGGMMQGRHNAFFVGSDGSQFPTAYASPDTKLRLIMEYENVPQTFTNVSLVWANQRIPGVAMGAADANAPAGTIPQRRAMSVPAGQTAAAANGTPGATQAAVQQQQQAPTLDQASTAIDKAKDQKKKGIDTLNKLKTLIH